MAGWVAEVGEVRAMIILITQGGGVQNWAKVEYVICGRSLSSFEYIISNFLSECLESA